MKIKKAGALALSIFLLAGCSLLPEVRVFQKKVPVEQVSPIVLEGQRQGADYIEQKSSTPGKDPVKTIEDIHSVASPLSASLGKPKSKVNVENKDSVIDSLQKALLTEQKKADDWKKFAQKYGGTQLEGTGINLAAPGALLGVGTLIALFIFVPGTLTVALWVIRRAKSTLTQVAQSVEEYQAQHPEGAAQLKERLAINLDRGEKKLISEAKKFIKPKAPDVPPTT